MYIYLCYDVASFPTEQWLVEQFELQAQFAHVVANAKTIGQRCQPIHDISVAIPGNQSLYKKREKNISYKSLLES